MENYMKKGGNRTTKTFMKNGRKHRLTEQQKGFAEEMAKGKIDYKLGKTKKPISATRAALKAYDTTDYHTGASIGSENLNKPEIINYIESYVEKHVEDARKLAKENSLRAVQNIVDLGNHAEGESVRLKANESLVKIAGIKEEEVQSTVNIESMVFQLQGNE